jgi:DNA-binding PadR family transcriptional regulator
MAEVCRRSRAHRTLVLLEVGGSEPAYSLIRLAMLAKEPSHGCQLRARLRHALGRTRPSSISG